MFVVTYRLGTLLVLGRRKPCRHASKMAFGSAGPRRLTAQVKLTVSGGSWPALAPGQERFDANCAAQHQRLYRARTVPSTQMKGDEIGTAGTDGI
jgi:hypothetical protein